MIGRCYEPKLKMCANYCGIDSWLKKKCGNNSYSYQVINQIWPNQANWKLRDVIP